MTLLTAQKPWKVPPLEFPAGTYFVEAATAGMAMHCNGGIRVQTFDGKKFDPAADWNGKRVLLCRSGGFGDLLFLTPALRAMRKKWPGMSVTLATTEFYKEALADNPVLDAIIAYPVPAAVLESYDGVIWLEGLIEWDERARTVNSVDLHADAIGVELTEGREMEFHGHLRHMDSMRQRFPKVRPGRRGAVPRIGVQISASARCRSYPKRLMGEVVSLLVNWLEPFGGQVVLFDTPRPGEDPGPLHPCLISLPTEMPPLSFGQSCAVLADCDGVIAPDSALCHVAGALRIPTVGLYGPFPWELRTIHAPMTVGINGKGCDKAPCFWHDREGVFPKDGPCSALGRCVALESIEPKEIVRTLKEVMRRSPGYLVAKEAQRVKTQRSEGAKGAKE